MSIDKLLRKAIEKHESLEYEEAGRLYKKILATKPRHLDANYLLGTLYAESGDYEKAKQHLVKAEGIDPSSPRVRVNLGNTYRKLGNYDLALKCFSRAIQLMPNLYEAHLGLGSTLVELDEDYEKAAECFQRALALSPNDAAIYHQMGVLSVKAGDIDKGFEYLETARGLRPDMPDIQLESGLIYLRTGKTKKAEECLREVLRISPGNIKANFFLEIAEGRTPGNQLMQDYSRTEFDSFAATFEKTLTGKLHYAVPQITVQALKKAFGEDFRFDAAVDLGCGTGLTGAALRGFVGHLTGIDISKRMIELARAKNCFDQLHCGDLVAVLNAQEQLFDLIVATDVLIYIGAMDDLMAAIVSKARPEGLFLFSTELLDGKGLLVQHSGRYAHSSKYIHSIMKKHGCSVVCEEVIDLRLEAGAWIKGNLFVVRVHGTNRPRSIWSRLWS